MQKSIFVFLSILCIAVTSDLSGAAWNLISLPNQYIVPQQSFKPNVYSTQFPTSPLVWDLTTECNDYQPTSVHWKSNLMNNVKGISFKGLVYKDPKLGNQGNSQNSFAVFFHQNECYNGGSEYGWIFMENALPQAKIYLCQQCNLNGQNWTVWPDASSDLIVISGNESAVVAALQNSAVYRYWNIEIGKNGNITLQLMDPTTYATVSVVLKKPAWFPNLFNLPGYVTITAKKQAETTISPAPFMHIDDVNIYQ